MKRFVDIGPLTKLLDMLNDTEKRKLSPYLPKQQENAWCRLKYDHKGAREHNGKIYDSF